MKPTEHAARGLRADPAAARGVMDGQLWTRAAAFVVELNARIAMVGARVSRAGVRVAVPELLGLGGGDAQNAVDWCVRTTEHLKATQIALFQRLGEQQRTRAAAAHAHDGSATAHVEVSTALARYQEMMCERYRGETGAPIVTRLDADMWVALRSLDPDAYDEDHAKVLDSAARIARHAAYAPEAGPLVARLRETIDAVNRATAGRRLAATWLYALECTNLLDTASPSLNADTVAKLFRVVSGDAEFDVALRREAWEAMQSADEVTRRNYLTEIAHSCFAELGYELDARSAAGVSTALEYRRATRRGAYRARVWVDEHSVIQGRLLSTCADDVSHADFSEDLLALSRRITAAARLGGTARARR